MMKRAVILHGTDGSPETNWFPWLKQNLEAQGYEVWAPLLPENHTPNRHTYNDFLFNSEWDFTDNIVVGHSSGAVSVLNLLMDERSPHISLGVMVGAWAKMDGTELELEQFKGLFPEEGFDFARIKSKANKLYFLHGDDDPYCPLDQAKWLAQQLDGEIKLVPNGYHLGAGFSELPELLEIIGANKD
jgi:predicted alpha/beta hydrolase family esterase